MFSWFGKVSFVPYTKISDFARHLKDGRLMASRCAKCGETTFPPRADCPACLAGEFEYQEVSGKATLHTFTKIDAAPTGFEDEVPYIVGVADLDDGGRILAWIGETLENEDLRIGMDLQVVPRMFEEIEQIKVYYTLEKPGTTWPKSDSA